MKTSYLKESFTRREILNILKSSPLFFLMQKTPSSFAADNRRDIFHIENIPDNPYYTRLSKNHHAGIDTLLFLMGSKELKFYRSSTISPLSGPKGLIAPEDVVLLKVNAQWKHRGCTNSDLIRGLIQRILDHPDVFSGEVIIIENSQGRGGLNCNAESHYGDADIQANANNAAQSFQYLVSNHFKDPRVSLFSLDDIRHRFIDIYDHQTDGYRRLDNVSYPCFTTEAGYRVELKEGLWTGRGHEPRLKLINVPVLKHHDIGGSEITAALKHMYGILSMADGHNEFRHYQGLGETCGRMFSSVCAPVLNLIDAVWVSHSTLKGYPPSSTARLNQIAASQDPVALDYWAAKYILFPVNNNHRHHPDFPGIKVWLEDARNTINNLGGLRDTLNGIGISSVSTDEKDMRISSRKAERFSLKGRVVLSDGVGLAGVRFDPFPSGFSTDEEGHFQVMLINGWMGVLRPKKEGYVFTPASRTYLPIKGSQSEQIFRAERAAHRLILSSAPGGTTDPAPGNHLFLYGKTLSIKALPAWGYDFEGWSGDLTGRINPANITMNADRQIQAEFSAAVPPARQLRGLRIANRSLFTVEHVIKLFWKAETSDGRMAGFRIYERRGTNWSLLTEQETDSREYFHRGVEARSPHRYALVCVSRANRESPPPYHHCFIGRPSLFPPHEKIKAFVHPPARCRTFKRKKPRLFRCLNGSFRPWPHYWIRRSPSAAAPSLFITEGFRYATSRE